MTSYRLRITQNCSLSVFFLIELFFVFAFFKYTYSANIYVIFGLALLPIILFKKQATYSVAALFVLLVSISLLYFFVHDFRAFFRVIKTAVIFLPLLLFGALQKYPVRLSGLFSGFMRVSALLVYLDFLLYFVTGRMLMTDDVSGFLPRPSGLMEDSNFFSYLMVVYVFFRKRMTGRFDFFLIISIFLSGSLAAISAFMIIAVIFKATPLLTSWNNRILKISCVVGAFLLLGYYYVVAFNYKTIVENLDVSTMDPLEAVKYYSVMHRFEAQNESLEAINSLDRILFGVGAGNTTTLNDRGINLHNTYLQLFLEQGLIVFILFLGLLITMMFRVNTLFYTLIASVLLLLGTMLEVFYYPLLSFVFFLSFIDIPSKDDYS